MDVPITPLPLFANEDANVVIGDHVDLPLSRAPSRPPSVVYAGAPDQGATALLLRLAGSDAGVLRYEAVRLVRIWEVSRTPDGSRTAQVRTADLGPDADLHGVGREDLRDVLARAAARDPAVATGWRRPALPDVAELADRPLGAIGDDLIRRLPMLLSTRLALLTRSEDERLAALVGQLRAIADGTPPEPQTAQRLDRKPVHLPAQAVPVVVEDFYLPPGSVVTIRATDWICDRALAAGWLALTTDVSVGRVVIVTRPLRSVETGVAGWHVLTLDQLRPAVIRSLGWWRDGIVVELDPAPSAVDAVAVGQPAAVERERLADYVARLGLAFAQDPRIMGPASGQAYRLWQAGRFTSLRALLSWQIGQLPFARSSPAARFGSRSAKRLRSGGSVWHRSAVTSCKISRSSIFEGSQEAL